MLDFNRSGRLLVAVVGIATLAACADQTAYAPAPTTVAMSAPVAAPQQVGGWYQVQFDTNKSDINQRGHQIINAVAAAVQADNAVRVTLIGKTDRVGDAASNMVLSEKRAEHVRDALIATGRVPAHRIDTRWSGEGKQDVRTPNDVAEQRNRVVDITVQ